MQVSRWSFGIVSVLVVALTLAGCDDALQKVVAPASSSGSQSDTIKIASFNIQVFGTSKLKKPKVMDVLAKVVRRFDVVAIQEIRSTDDSVMPKFIQLINADGSHYDFATVSG